MSELGAGAVRASESWGCWNGGQGDRGVTSGGLEGLGVKVHGAPERPVGGASVQGAYDSDLGRESTEVFALGSGLASGEPVGAGASSGAGCSERAAVAACDRRGGPGMALRRMASLLRRLSSTYCLWQTLSQSGAREKEWIEVVLAGCGPGRRRDPEAAPSSSATARRAVRTVSCQRC